MLPRVPKQSYSEMKSDPLTCVCSKRESALGIFVGALHPNERLKVDAVARPQVP